MRVTDVMIVMWARGCASVLRGSGVRVSITNCDPHLRRAGVRGEFPGSSH